MAIGIDTGFLVASEIGEHPGHRVARDLLIEQASKRNTFVLCPQVLAEFIHVVTDPRRFKNPIPMPEPHVLLDATVMGGSGAGILQQ